MKDIAKEFNLGVVFGMKVVCLRHFGLCGFQSHCFHCLNEYLHLWDSEPLVLMARFYNLSAAIYPLESVCYSLAVLDNKCLLGLCPSLISIRYILH